MNNTLNLDPTIVLAAAVLMFIISLLFIFVLWIKLGRMKKRYKKIMNGNSNIDLEEVIMDIQSKLNEYCKRNEQNSKLIQVLSEDIKERNSRMAMHRYNAFHQSGSDLSFSIAILNDYDDGVVLTGIHNRDDTYVYAKPLEKGQSKYTLSPEELHVIEKASVRKKG